jgi:hypothetical protein
MADTPPPEPFPTEEAMFRRLARTIDVAWRLPLKRQDIEEWLGNFKGEVFDVGYERRMALWLLQNFVYYAEDEVRALCRLLYRRFVHWHFSGLHIKGGQEALDSLESLHRRIRFYQLGRPGGGDRLERPCCQRNLRRASRSTRVEVSLRRCPFGGPASPKSACSIWNRLVGRLGAVDP